MYGLLLTALLAFAAPTTTLATTPVRPRSHDVHDYYAVHIDPRSDVADVASHLGFEVDGPIGALEHHYLLRAPKHASDVVEEAVRQRKRDLRRRGLSRSDHPLDSVLLAQKQKLRAPHQKRIPPLFDSQLPARQNDGGDQTDGNVDKPPSAAEVKGAEIAKELDIQDPIYNEQWHLYNPVQLGNDLNVTGVWLQGITGKNATVCIVDDGLDFESRDLAPNYFAAGSYDFNDAGPDPKPRLSDDRHGTRCAGEVAAARNDVCGVGVAYDSRIAGIRILSAPITDADEAAAMMYGFDDNDIYSCSWGPPDDGKEMGAPGILIKRAMITAVQRGRAGRGTIYVFAAGNGAGAGDNCNFDGYTNSIYSITVGAIDRDGRHPYYSEKCSAQLVVTYSSGSQSDAIHTTDVGSNVCYRSHGGTSAAGPLVAGVLALVLEVRPDLTWRDAQYLVVQNAIPFDVGDDWQNTSIGKPFSHQFGYGKIDAWQVVEAAKSFQSVKPQAWFFSPWQHIRHAIPQGDVGLGHNYTVTAEQLKKANLARLEHVTVTMNVKHTRRGDLSVELRSPSGVVSHLSTARRNDDYNGGYDDWTFMSVAHWGESGIGNWSIVVKDTVQNDHQGELIDWKLSLWGEAIDGDKQELLPLPTDHDDDDHDRETGTPVTTSVAPTSIHEPTENPSDHPDRPINIKTSQSTGVTAAPATTTTAAYEPPILATATPASSRTRPALGEGTSRPTQTPASDNFLPSPFPTFGVSKRSQVWIYGALILIVLFCVGLSVYLFLVKRRQQRQAGRDDYEFEVLEDDDDDDDGRGGAGGRGSGKKGKKRAGELYDAFAGESDEDLFSDDEKYHDRERDELDEKNRHSSEEGSSGSSARR